MIHRLDDFSLENFFHLLQIDDHAGDGIGVPLDGYFNDVVMPMAIGIGFLTEELAIFRFA